VIKISPPGSFSRFGSPQQSIDLCTCRLPMRTVGRVYDRCGSWREKSLVLLRIVDVCWVSPDDTTTPHPTKLSPTAERPIPIAGAPRLRLRLRLSCELRVASCESRRRFPRVEIPGRTRECNKYPLREDKLAVWRLEALAVRSRIWNCTHLQAISHVLLAWRDGSILLS
jgi:hypothetical protein